jgi:hypothetical protein
VLRAFRNEAEGLRRGGGAEIMLKVKSEYRIGIK